MGECKHCESDVLPPSVLPTYETDQFGIKLILLNTAIEEKCGKCNEVTISFPHLKGLFAAVAISRIKVPLKLNGQEIRFLRKALGMSAKKLAESLEITVETVSRWENNKAPIGPSYEKLLRLWVGTGLQDRAPLIPFAASEILNMQMEPNLQNQQIELTLALVKAKIENKIEEAYSEAA